MAASEHDDGSCLPNDGASDDRDLEQYHVRLIEEGIRQADRCELIDHRDVVRNAVKARTNR